VPPSTPVCKDCFPLYHLCHTLGLDCPTDYSPCDNRHCLRCTLFVIRADLLYSLLTSGLPHHVHVTHYGRPTVTHSIVQAPLQSELLPVFKSTSQDQNTPFWSSSNRHPVSFISWAASFHVSSSPFHLSSLSSHLSSTFHLLSFHLSGSAITPSHIQRGPSVAIPSVRRSQLSPQQLHPHYPRPSRTTLSDA
jgi:hypothetical protein